MSFQNKANEDEIDLHGEELSERIDSTQVVIEEEQVDMEVKVDEAFVETVAEVVMPEEKEEIEILPLQEKVEIEEIKENNEV